MKAFQERLSEIMLPNLHVSEYRVLLRSWRLFFTPPLGGVNPNS